MPRTRTYDESDLKVAVAESVSIRQVLSKLGLREAGGNYRTVHRFIKTLGLDISHFTGQASTRGKRYPERARPLEFYLVENCPSIIMSHDLKKRLIKEGVFEHKCYSCGRETWMGVPIPLELEHINGIHSDCRKENLTLLCPNCHALTPTYRGKNIASLRNGMTKST